MKVMNTYILLYIHFIFLQSSEMFGVIILYKIDINVHISLVEVHVVISHSK